MKRLSIFLIFFAATTISGLLFLHMFQTLGFPQWTFTRDYPFLSVALPCAAMSWVCVQDIGGKRCQVCRDHSAEITVLSSKWSDINGLAVCPDCVNDIESIAYERQVEENVAGYGVGIKPK